MIADSFSTPTLLVDQQKVLRNIERMVKKARQHDLVLRPHCKTHQSHEVANWLRDFGIREITVSSVQMARYFAEDQWEDITIAFPVNIREMKRIDQLAQTTQLNLVIENTAALEVLQHQLSHPVNVFLKVDTGYQRTGAELSEEAKIARIVDLIKKSSKLHFKGILGHAGHSYKAKSLLEIESVHQSSLDRLQAFKALLSNAFENVFVSTGDTPTCSKMQYFPGVDEIRPGNFVFYDLAQWGIGSCDLPDMALVMSCPVVAKHASRNEIVVYGGGVHFSKDRATLPDGTTYYGMVNEFDGHEFIPLGTENYVRSLSQEHGIVKVSDAIFEKTEIGEMLHISPIHSCMTADIMKRYYTLSGQLIQMMPI